MIASFFNYIFGYNKQNDICNKTDTNKIDKLCKKLPYELVNIILDYDGRIKYKQKNAIDYHKYVNVIHKYDERYNLLKFITFKLDCVEYYGGELKCRHYFHNLHDYEERQQNNSDLIQVDIKENEDSIKYSVWIGKQYQKSVKSNKTQIYHIENPLEYNWIYTEYKYIRT